MKLNSLGVLCILFTSLSNCSSTLTSQGGHLVYAEHDLLDYIGRWEKRDGIASKVLSDYFLDFLMVRPELFLDAISGHSTVAESWLSELADNSFVDFGACAALACRRDAVLGVVKNATPTTKRGEEFRRELSAVLETIEIRRID